ncbi:hypothetical protein RRF57_008265 [Xylaria bambusicola]|uniref:Uncharacterized protein n=1 Tax=Xylaria bambusicola TaxID=326684 RepID=A0AAN7UTN6_9PEZI
MKLMRELGSDLNINAFSLSFRYEDGRLSDDIEAANYLMQRPVEMLLVDSPIDDPTKIPSYLTSTDFSDELYGKYESRFIERLGLEQSTQTCKSPLHQFRNHSEKGDNSLRGPK